MPSLSKLRPANDVSLPIKPIVKADNRRKVSSDISKIDKMSSTAGSKYRALVIEDSLVVRKSLTRVLVNLGFQVTQATNGMDGLKELKKSMFHLVLCDFLMPILDGLDCIKQFRRWEAAYRPYFRQYIVGISAHASEKDIEQGLKVGMDEFRSKPVSYAQLAELKDRNQFKRIAEEIQSLQQNPVSLKRRKLEEKTEWSVFGQSFKKGCLVIEKDATLLELAKGTLENIGWNVVSANNIEDATRMLKMRNWDAVFVDDDLSCSRCITDFREWELTHRVNRQKNMILISAHYEPSKGGGSSVFQVPTGFDGALPKLVNKFELQDFLEQSSSSCNIVLR